MSSAGWYARGSGRVGEIIAHGIRRRKQERENCIHTYRLLRSWLPRALFLHMCAKITRERERERDALTGCPEIRPASQQPDIYTESCEWRGLYSVALIPFCLVVTGCWHLPGRPIHHDLGLLAVA